MPILTARCSRRVASATAVIVAISTIHLLLPSGASWGAAAAGKQAAARPAPGRTSPTPGRAGMVVGVDPASGEIGPPTSEPLEALRSGSDPSLDRSTVGLERITRADGSQYVNLRGRFRAYSVVTIGADGSARVACLEDLSGALRALRVTAVGAPRATARAPFGPQEE